MQDGERDPFELNSRADREDKPSHGLLPGLFADPQDDVDWVEQADPEGEAAERKRDLRIVIVWAVIVMALLAALILYLQLRKTRIGLDDYVIIETDGYETIGTAVGRFDAEAFIQDYKETVRYQGGKPNTKVDDCANAAEALVERCIKGELNRSEDLSNGDTVTFVWDCDDAAAARDFHCVLQYSNIDQTVEDLADPLEFDPFSAVEVDFSGTAPNGTAAVRLTSEEEVYQSLTYELNKTRGLRNGDTVRLTVSAAEGGDLADSTLRAYGMVPVASEKEYTVSGLTMYASSIAEIPADAMARMQTKAEDIFQNEEMPTWRSGATLTNREYLGAYLLVPALTGAETTASADGGTLLTDLTKRWEPAAGNTASPFGLPFGWGSGDDEEDGSQESGGDDGGFHWSDLLDPTFYGFGDDRQDEDENGEDSRPDDSQESPQTPAVPYTVPEPREEDSGNWNGLEDLLHTEDFGSGRQNILYLVYRVDVTLGRSFSYSYYTYTAFAEHHRGRRRRL